MSSSAHQQAFMAPGPCELLGSRRESEDTVTLTLSVPPNYGRWHPGQFNMLYLFGLGEVPISISGDPSEANSLTHTVKAVGAVSAALTSLAHGARVWLRGPFGTTWPSPASSGCLLMVAGGLGLAPLRSAILQVLRSQRPARTCLLYGVKNPADVLFKDELCQWQQRSDLEVHITADRVSDKQQWSGSIGTVTHLMQHLELVAEQTMVMTCGPDVMMRHVVSELNSMGVANRQIYVSLERNMKCALGLCGRCQWGPYFMCRDGPVFCMADIRRFWTIKDL